MKTYWIKATVLSLFFSIFLVFPAVSQKAKSAKPAAKTAPPTVVLSVDATQAPRKIFHAKLTIPASPGTLTLYYPEWIPGEHGPTGPAQKLAGLKFTANGQTQSLHRDLQDHWTVHVY